MQTTCSIFNIERSNIDETWGESNIFGCTSPEEVLERMIVSDG